MRRAIRKENLMPDNEFPGFGRIHIPPGWQKPCGSSHWGEGVLAVRSETTIANAKVSSSTFDDLPIGVVSDGLGGAFVVRRTSVFGTGTTVQHCFFLFIDF